MMLDRAEARSLSVPLAVRWGAFVLLASALLVARRPETIFRAEFFYEDGQVFYIGAWFGTIVEQIGRTYAGYILLIPRVVAALERQIAVAYAPLLGNAISLGMVALLAGYVASDRLANVLPERRTRVLAAVSLLLLPGSWETLGSVTLVEWYLALFLIFASLASAPRNQLAAAIELLAVIGSSLTGPFSLLFAPLFWARLVSRRDRWSILLAVAVTSGAVIQLAALVLSGDRAPTASNLAVLGELLTFRLWATLIGGFWMSALIPLGLDPGLVAGASLLLLAAIFVVWTTMPRLLGATLAYAALIVLAGVVADQPNGLPASPFLAQRYLVVPGVCIAVAVSYAFGRLRLLSAVRRRATIAVAGILIFGVVGDFRLVPHPDYEWALRSACIGGKAPCEVPVEFPNAWTIHWPGEGGAYVQPNPYARSNR
jgi:hypothetical protein